MVDAQVMVDAQAMSRSGTDPGADEQGEIAALLATLDGEQLGQVMERFGARRANMLGEAAREHLERAVAVVEPELVQQVTTELGRREAADIGRLVASAAAPSITGTAAAEAMAGAAAAEGAFAQGFTAAIPEAIRGPRSLDAPGRDGPTMADGKLGQDSGGDSDAADALVDSPAARLRDQAMRRPDPEAESQAAAPTGKARGKDVNGAVEAFIESLAETFGQLGGSGSALVDRAHDLLERRRANARLRGQSVSPAKPTAAVVRSDAPQRAPEPALKPPPESSLVAESSRTPKSPLSPESVLSPASERAAVLRPAAARSPDQGRDDPGSTASRFAGPNKAAYLIVDRTPDDQRRQIDRLRRALRDCSNDLLREVGQATAKEAEKLVRRPGDAETRRAARDAADYVYEVVRERGLDPGEYLPKPEPPGRRKSSRAPDREAGR